MVPMDGELLVGVWSTACSTAAPTPPDAAMRTTAAMVAIPQLPRCLRLGWA